MMSNLPNCAALAHLVVVGGEERVGVVPARVGACGGVVEIEAVDSVHAAYHVVERPAVEHRVQLVFVFGA